MEIKIALSQESIEYLDSDPYIRDKGAFLDMLIRRWIKEKNKSREDALQAEKDPNVLMD